MTEASNISTQSRTANTVVNLATYFTINNNNLVINFNPSWIGNDNCYYCVAAN